MDQDSAHMVAASKVPMLKSGEFELWRMRIEQYIQMIDYALWEVIKNGATLPKTVVVEGVEKLKFNSINDAKLLLEAVEKRFGGNPATKKTQRNLLKQQYENFTAPSSEMLDQTFDRLQKLVSQLELLDEKLSQEEVKSKVIKKLSLRSAELQEIKTTRTRKAQGVCLWKHLLPQIWCHVMALVDMTRVIRQRKGLIMHSWLTHLKSFDSGFNDSNCSKSCMETVKLLKSQNDQLLRDLEKSSLMVLGYKTSLESVEEKLEFYKKNESVYVENINGLKWDIQVGEITIRELRKKLKKFKKKKIPFNLISTSLYKKFMPPTPDLSFTRLDEFVNEPVVENCKAMSSEEVSKVVRKSDDSLIIKDWVSDSTQSNGFAGTKTSDNASQARKETKPVKDYILLPLWTADPPYSQDSKSSHNDGSKPSNDDGKKVDED
ncbi:hypothetical protein Tco_0836323 [Tanacetum coccineum]